ncbi:hypothetical protein [Algimonas arctica]|uniref:hypothetical protein n=1 Tax=Algimonas arctica TaxID=1479486 RepID=UPI001675E1D8|nr:hypothetical protein [Algimonas arctica]
MKRWLDYWRTVGGRITWDRSVLRGLWIVPYLQFRHRMSRPAKRGTIAYYPQPAGPWYTLPLALAGTGIRLTRDLKTADAVMIFDDRTVSDVTLPHTQAKLLNVLATDISKAHVGRVFEAVFGYPLTLDPLTHLGPMVQKSDGNGLHDGQIVQGPLSAPLVDCVYQHPVESTVRKGVTEDLRCACVGGVVVQVFRKEKACESRFQAVYLETTLRDPDTTFSREERQLITQFCAAMGLDFGSMDVLRDYSEGGRLYIVDVNKTCMPVLSMPVGELEIGLRRIGKAAEALILSA